MSKPLQDELVVHYVELEELLQKIKTGKLKLRLPTTKAHIEQAVALLILADHHR
jgi:hypothetical protein